MSLRSRVAFGQGFAYRRDEILLVVGENSRPELGMDLFQGGEGPAARALGALAGLASGHAHLDDEQRAQLVVPYLGAGRARVREIADPVEAVVRLAEAGHSAQVNHAVFANGCGPHPASGSNPRANPLYANPLYANPLYANPLYANPLYANPLYANPLYANPLYANPLYANPLYANPLYANPLYANAGHGAGGCACHSPERRGSSARPAPAPGDWPHPDAVGSPDIRIVIIDSGYADTAWRPTAVPAKLTETNPEEPDEDGDGWLDPVAGHGTFIAGCVEFLAPGCSVEVLDAIEPEGDGDEGTVVALLSDLAARDEKPHIVNLSFGGYSCEGMLAMQAAIEELAKHSIIVASAGNDGVCIPMYPAAFEEVLGVGALESVVRERDGNPELVPAVFTNHGDWVDACADGTDVVSTFFTGFSGPGTIDNPAGVDSDDFHGWARWSGTSFAAPRVAGVLAAKLCKRIGPNEAIGDYWPQWRRDVVDEVLSGWRMPQLGYVVDAPRPGRATSDDANE